MSNTTDQNAHTAHLLPHCLACRIMTQLRYNEELMHKFFAASAPVTDTMCPTDTDNPNCAVCLFPEFSTLISAAFALMYLFVLWMVLGRIASTAINKMLARRIRLLQVGGLSSRYHGLLHVVSGVGACYARGTQQTDNSIM